MQPEFWQDRWASNQIGFHQREVNPYLQRHWPVLGLPEGAKVLVPLCGKSLDLVWLESQGYPVMGVELSEHAVEAFFSEQGLVPHVSHKASSRSTRRARSNCGVAISSAWMRRRWSVAAAYMIAPR